MRLLRRFIQPIRYSYLEYRHSAAGEVQTPDRAYMSDLVKLLHPVDFASYRTEHGLAASLMVMHENVGDASAFLKRAADLLSAGEMVPVEELKARPRLVSLDEWLTVANGFYVNPVEGLAQFVEHAERLLKVFAAHEHEKVGIYAASWRQMRTFLIGLQTLLVNLVLTSHECLRA